MKRSTISAGRIEMTFGPEPLAVRRLRNTITGAAACLNGAQSLLVRMPSDVSEPIFLNRIRSAEAFSKGIRISLADETNAVRGEVVIGPSANGIRFQVKVTAPRPIWMVEWQLSGLRLKQLIVPALGGQLVDASMPPGTTLSYKYPFWWNAQFVVGSMGQGGIWLRAMNPSPHFSMLRIARTNGTFALTYGFEAEGPLRSTRLEGEFYLDGYQGGWKAPAEIHRRCRCPSGY